jgi:hypothetical protein
MNAPIYSNEDLLQNGEEGGGGTPEAPSDPDALKKFLEKLDPQDLGRFQP